LALADDLVLSRQGPVLKLSLSLSGQAPLITACSLRGTWKKDLKP